MRILRHTQSGAVLLLVLGACVPLPSMPPPLPSASPNGGKEVGAALVAGPGASYAGVAAWYTQMNEDEETTSGVLVGFDGTGIPWYVATSRFPIRETDRTFIGCQLNVTSLLGTGLGIPLSVAVRDGFWLYTNPSVAIDYWFDFGRLVGAGGDLPVRVPYVKLPIGLALGHKSSMRFLVEGGVQSGSVDYPNYWLSIGASKSFAKWGDWF
jgi:hypothetical protein